MDVWVQMKMDTGLNRLRTWFILRFVNTLINFRFTWKTNTFKELRHLHYVDVAEITHVSYLEKNNPYLPNRLSRKWILIALKARSLITLPSSFYWRYSPWFLSHVQILWLSSQISKTHCLQIFFNWIHLHDSRPAYSSNILCYTI
jgi:hypothetical protein